MFCRSARSTIFVLLLFFCCGPAAMMSCSPAGPYATADDTDADRPATAVGIQWQPYRNAVSLAREQDKKVYLYFFADWCRYCKVMEETTFVHEAVIARLNRHFIAVRINLDENKKLAEEYSIQGVPASWFLEEDGKNVGGRPGYMPPDQFIELLDVVITEAYKK